MSQKPRVQVPVNVVSSPPRGPTSSAPKRGKAKKPGKTSVRAPGRAAPRSRVRVSTLEEEVGEEIDLDAEMAKQGLDSDDTDDQDEAPPAPAGPAKNSRPPRSGVHDPFIDPSRTQSTKTASTADIQYFFERNESASTCKSCREMHDADPIAWKEKHSTRRTYVYASKSGTSTLRGHVDRWHLHEYLELVESRGWPIWLDSVKKILALGYSLVEIREAVATSGTLDNLRERKSGTGQREMAVTDGRHALPPFSKEEFYKRLITFIVADDQSMSIVECKEFRELLLILRESLRDSDIPHRTSIRNKIIETSGWKQYLTSLKIELGNALGRISFTTDVWSAGNMAGFMALTGHWISEDSQNQLQLRSALLGFTRLKGKHDGDLLARTILALLDRVGATSKVGHFSMDNASNNSSCMQQLGILLAERDIEFDAQDRQIRCFPHIIHICVKHVMDSFSTSILEDIAHSWVDAFPNRADRDQYAAAIKKDPIKLGRSIVIAIRSSGQRRDEFLDTIKKGNANNWFKPPGSPVELLPEHELKRDAETRWDSSYTMIDRLIEMHLAVDYFLGLPNHRDLEKLKMSDWEWMVLQDYHTILDIPHVVQHRVSGEKLPRLGLSVPYFELFMTGWDELHNTQPRLRPWLEVGLRWATKYYKRMDDTIAYVVAMLVEPSIRMSWIEDHWGDEYIGKSRKIVLDLMHKYHYQLPQQLPSESKPRLDDFNAIAARLRIKDVGGRRNVREVVNTVEDEYSLYVKGTLTKQGEDPLRFWDANRKTYPILFSIAMDYLPIQASAVPCERIFSSSSETDTKKRNRISAIVMEALQMLKYQYKKERLDFSQNPVVNVWEVMDDPEEHFDTGHAGVQGADVRDAIHSIIEAVEREELFSQLT